MGLETFELTDRILYARAVRKFSHAVQGKEFFFMFDQLGRWCCISLEVVVDTGTANEA